MFDVYNCPYNFTFKFYCIISDSKPGLKEHDGYSLFVFGLF